MRQAGHGIRRWAWQGAKAFPSAVARVMENQQEATGGAAARGGRLVTGAMGSRPHKASQCIRDCEAGFRARREAQVLMLKKLGKNPSNSLAIEMDGDVAPQPGAQAQGLNHMESVQKPGQVNTLGYL